jgi:hypothetical protein
MSDDGSNFPATPTTSGWYPVGDGSDQETFWDGTTWTRRREFRFGSPPREIPLHPSDPPLAHSPTPPGSSTPASTSSAPAPTTPPLLKRSEPSVEPMNRTWSQPTPTQTTPPSPRFRSSRQRIRLVQLIYLIAIIGFFVTRQGQHTTTSNPEKYFVILFVVGLVVRLILWRATSGARGEVRDQESERRPRWPFRYLSRLTDGLQGPRLTSFIGGIRTQPRLTPEGFNATVPLVRLSLFSNGLRVGPSTPLLSMSVPTWEARFDELDVIQAIGRVRGVTTGILFRKSQSHEWVIFWTSNREEVFTTLEQMNVTVSREPVRLRTGNQFRVNQFVEGELRPTEPSVLGLATATATTSTSSPGASPSFAFTAPPLSTGSHVATTAPEDKKWPGVVVFVVVAFVVASVFAFVFTVFDTSNSASPGASPGGGVVTTLPTPVVTVSPAGWRAFVTQNARYLSQPLAAIPSSILHLRYNYGSTQNGYNLTELMEDLKSMSLDCGLFHNLAAAGAPSPALAQDASSVNAACDELVSVDRGDLNSADHKWTPKLASNDAHWVKILTERVAVLKTEAAN